MEDQETTPMPVSLEKLAKAFEAWERDFRAAPTKFMTADECAAAQVSQLSAGRAAHFASLLAQVD